MGGRLECIIRTAAQTFTTRSNGQFAHSNVAERVQCLRQLVSEINPAEDIGLTRSVGQPQSQKSFFSSNSVAPVSYMEIFENPTITVGVFILKEGAAIPTHDHVGMHGIIKVLYGKLKIQSYTDLNPASSSRTCLVAKKLPLALLGANDDPAVLSPSEANIHHIAAVEGSASFLDILAPPYSPDEDDSRDCFYYKDMGSAPGFDSSVVMLSRIPCPSSFWCNTTQYSGPNIQHLIKELAS